MTVYLVERYLPGWTPDEIAALVGTIRARRDELDARCVHHLSSIVLPGDETCLCLFDAADADQVRTANTGLGLPVDRVVAGELVVGDR
jgi:hypothetical protein